MPTYPQSIAAQLAALVAEVHRGTAPEASGLRDLIDSACEHVVGAQYAGITVADRAAGITRWRLASLSRAVGRDPAALPGRPCVSAAWEHATMHIRDLETDHRWPRYRHDVLSQSPIRSVMAFELFADGPTMGALELLRRTVIRVRRRIRRTRTDLRHPRFARMGSRTASGAISQRTGQPRPHRSGKGHDHGAVSRRCRPQLSNC